LDRNKRKNEKKNMRDNETIVVYTMEAIALCAHMEACVCSAFATNYERKTQKKTRKGKN
jgi:hypothetical protein